MAYHHIVDISKTTAVITHFLKPGGTLVVIDMSDRPEVDDSADPLFKEKHKEVVPHRHGFDEATMRAVFEGAGLVDFRYEPKVISGFKMHGQPTDLFLAKGTRPQ
jgi:hypothetical protein